MKPLVIAIHGIMTSQTDASWPDKFDAWMARRDDSFKVLKKEYAMGWWPLWNVWFKDPRLARALTNEIAEFCEGSGGKIYRHPEIWIVAHSNGCVITMLTLKLLFAMGIKVKGVILTGGACEADVNATGILDWVSRGLLGVAAAFSNYDDEVVKHKFIWPYGHLGHTGFTAGNAPFERWDDARQEKIIWTDRFAGYGHSGYFAPEHREDTFERFYQILTDV